MNKSDIKNSIPAIISAAAGTIYVETPDYLDVLPVPMGYIPGLDEQGVDMEVLLTTTRHIRPGTTQYGVPEGYYRVKSTDDGNAWFIFILRDIHPDNKMTELTLEDQAIDIHSFVRANFKTISYGNSKAAQEILKCCTIKI